MLQYPQGQQVTGEVPVTSISKFLAGEDRAVLTATTHHVTAGPVSQPVDSYLYIIPYFQALVNVLE